MLSRASETNDAVSQLLFNKYYENPPLLTSDSSAQIEENTFCEVDCCAKSSFPNSVLSDSERPIKISFFVGTT
jgi:hypothetical protein